MSYENIHLNINASLLKVCKDFILSEGLSADYDVFDFDAHASLNDLPNKGLIGIAEYSLAEDSDMYSGECMIVISTMQDDLNLQKLKPLVSKMFSKWRTGQEIAAVTADNGTLIGNIKVHSGTEALSVARTQSRPLQMISVSFGLATVLSP